MNQANSKFLRMPASLFLLLILISLAFSGCKKEEPDGTLSGVLTYSYGFVKDDGGLSDITKAYCYVFLDTDDDITNGYVVRLTIDITNITPGTTELDYEFNTSGVPAGKYFLLAGYDFEVDNDGNTDPDNPSVWEGKGWYGSDNTTAPASANVSDLSADYDITIHGLAK